MKALQLFGTVMIAAMACNNPVKNPGQMEEDKQNNPSGPSSEEIATQAQQFKMGEGLRGSGIMTKGNYRFAVRVNGDGTERTIMIASQDLRGDTTKPMTDSTVLHDVKGKVTSTTVSDLDNDGNPEVFCFTKSDGTDAVGSVYGVTFIDHKPVRIFSGDVDKDSIPGYRGNDTFYVQQPYVVRKYLAEKNMKTIKYALKKDNQRYILRENK
ncbi:hypothetical protein [Chitinophaga sancti]|uniref:hypothetical protein n=1 Tax=Chitinophaga sancti TaxID=1004 RepID=UPI003F7AB8D7